MSGPVIRSMAATAKTGPGEPRPPRQRPRHCSCWRSSLAEEQDPSLDRPPNGHEGLVSADRGQPDLDTGTPPDAPSVRGPEARPEFHPGREKKRDPTLKELGIPNQPLLAAPRGQPFRRARIN